MLRKKRISSTLGTGRKRATWAVAVVTVSLLALAGCAASNPTSNAPETKAITVLVEAGGHGELQPIADLYTKQTGVKVTFLELPYAGLYSRVQSELSTGTVSFDVAALDAIWLPAFKDGLVSLNSFYTPAVKADNFASVVKGAKAGSDYVGSPAFANSEILYYRTDLFNDPANQTAFQAKYGYALKAPTTWQQYTDVAAFFTKDGNYGTDVKGAVETEFLATLSQAGEKNMVVDSNGKSTLGDAASLKALNYYTSLQKYAPAGGAQVDWAAAQNLFTQGKTAMMRFWAHAYRQTPKDSPVYGKVGVAPMIGGSAGVAGVPGPFYLSIPKATKNQTAAMKFLTFAYDHNSLSATTSLGLVARISALKEYQDKPGYESYGPMIATLNAKATISRPSTPKWQQIVDTVLVPMLQKSLEPGADNAALLKDAAAKVDALTAR